ncbi:Polycomb protein Su(z)12 [Pseudolycoriella hygida]|uniref:Polycomb protein Su(Z)12 n=1 Tax=Pseudolycoriella hygida TaxID=35572 RepID=A0A9Q0NCP4_9DIPT|nr:Polycomb protein Su(z)12 [Pseudolycoriella hygida]
MGPKKKEREADGVKIRSLEQTDHEIFLQAFEKPTQIYRYLRTRNMITPIFLYRNLSYMKERIKRTNKIRISFKVDSLLSKKMDEIKNGSNDKTLGEYMTLMFIGLFDKTLPDEEVEVETLVSKISHKKRKDSFKTLQERFGRSVVKINPDAASSDEKIPAVCVPTDNFKTPDESLHLSYKLQLNVKILDKFTAVADDSSEPLAKRYKSQNIVYESELLVFDKQKRRLLSDGEYEISLQEKLQPTKNSPKKLPSWEVIPETIIDSMGKENSFDEFQKFPKLKFHLAWTKEKCGDLVDRPSPLSLNNDESNKENQRDRKQNAAIEAKSTEKVQIIYQFIYNNNSRQQMEPCDNFCCIWCSLDCMVLYSLLKHLKLCHARFNFKYVPSNPAVRIDISINELYDGSPHDLIGSTSFAFSRAGPVRRTTVTRILVCRPRRLKPNLSEFLEIDENELNSQRPFITGHSRLYHHTMTCLPVHAKELDIESEDENDPIWLQQKTKMMIDEFTDVNEGEKELMKMWNVHLMHHGYVGDIQMPLACEMFIELKGDELLQKNNYKNFMMHLCNLFDCGVISGDDFWKSVLKLQNVLSKNEEGRKIIIEMRQLQVKYWNEVGLCKQHEQLKKMQESNKVPSTPTSSNEKAIKKESKTKLDDEKLHTAVVNLKSSKNGIAASTTNRKRESTQSKEGNVRIKQRRATLRVCSRQNIGSRRTTKLKPTSRRST